MISIISPLGYAGFSTKSVSSPYHDFSTANNKRSGSVSENEHFLMDIEVRVMMSQLIKDIEHYARTLVQIGREPSLDTVLQEKIQNAQLLATIQLQKLKDEHPQIEIETLKPNNRNFL